MTGLGTSFGSIAPWLKTIEVDHDKLISEHSHGCIATYESSLVLLRDGLIVIILSVIVLVVMVVVVVMMMVMMGEFSRHSGGFDRERRSVVA